MRKLLPLLLLAVFAAGCGISSTEINEIGLIYEGGVIQDKTYKGLLKTGSTNNQVGVGSEVYRYRIDQRSWVTGQDTEPVQVVSDDEVRLAVDYQLYFKLNTDETILRRFHENLGVKTNAWTKAGWVELLNIYFDPQIERALEVAALKHNWRDLFGSEESRVAFQKDTVTTLKRLIEEVIGDDYFCGPAYNGPGTDCGDFTFTVGKPYPVNEGIITAVEDEQKAGAETIAQEQRNERIRKELEAERELVELYGPNGALLRDAIRSGKIQFMVVPSGVDVAVPTGVLK